MFSPWYKNNHTQHRACKKYSILRTRLSCSCQYHVGVLCFRGPLWTWWPKHAQKHIMSSRTRQCLGISPGQYRLHGPPKVHKQLPVPVYKPALEFDEVQPIFAAASGKQCCHHHANTKRMIKCWVFISLSLSEHSRAMLLFWFTWGTAKEKLNLKAFFFVRASRRICPTNWQIWRRRKGYTNALIDPERTTWESRPCESKCCQSRRTISWKQIVRHDSGSSLCLRHEKHDPNASNRLVKSPPEGFDLPKNKHQVGDLNSRESGA